MEPDAAVADPVAPVARYSRATLITLATGVLAILAVVAALYLARGFFVPLLLGILGSYALRPLVERLVSFRVPRSVGAALVLALVVGGVSWTAFKLSDDAGAMIEKLPDAARKLRRELSEARAGAPSALQNVQAAAGEIEGAAADAGALPKPAARAPARAAPAAEAPTWLRDYTIAQTALLVTVAAQTPIVLLLTYFLLASGQHFRRKLLQLVGGSLTRKKDALHILGEVDTQVQRFLLATVASNTLIAVASWLAFLALGLEQAGVWGAVAGVLHFVPYLGSSLVALAVGTAAFLQSGSPMFALAVAGVSMLVAGSIGFVFMTWLQSRFARVNAAVLFIALLFFGWLWGAWGLLLGAPLVAIAKAVFDRVEALKPLGELMGR